MGVKEMMEQLLKQVSFDVGAPCDQFMTIVSYPTYQEELESLAQDTLKMDKDRLRGEVSRLQQDIERWKVGTITMYY